MPVFANKTQMMQAIANGLITESYHVRFFDGTPDIIFDISAMRIMLQRSRYKVKKYALDAGILEYIKDKREIDEQRVKDLKMDEYLNDPAIMVTWPDKKSDIVDGIHRIIRRSKQGLNFFLAYEVPLKYANIVDPTDKNLLHVENAYGIDNFVEKRAAEFIDKNIIL